MSYTLKLDEKDVGVILGILINGSYKVVAPILTEIQKQIAEQNESSEKKGV